MPYVSRSGVNIYYGTYGQGEPLVFCIPSPPMAIADTIKERSSWLRPNQRHTNSIELHARSKKRVAFLHAEWQAIVRRKAIEELQGKVESNEQINHATVYSSLRVCRQSAEGERLFVLTTSQTKKTNEPLPRAVFPSQGDTT